MQTDPPLPFAIGRSALVILAGVFNPRMKLALELTTEQSYFQPNFEHACPTKKSSGA
jgi:hypothetical protein